MNNLIVCTAFVGFFTDRLLKWYVAQMPAPQEAGIFSLGHFLNPALFFLPAWKWIPWLALVVLIGLIVFLIIRAGTKHLTPDTWSLIPILLGGASNVFDRFAYGGVIDILAIRNLGTFNLADLLIFWGLVVLLRR